MPSIEVENTANSDHGWEAAQWRDLGGVRVSIRLM